MALQAKKDVISCEKPRGGAKYPLSRGCLNGATRRMQIRHRKELTWGSETSQYPEERKSNETPKVAASEMGRGQTGWFRPSGVVGPPHVIQD